MGEVGGVGKGFSVNQKVEWAIHNGSPERVLQELQKDLNKDLLDSSPLRVTQAEVEHAHATLMELAGFSSENRKVFHTNHPSKTSSVRIESSDTSAAQNARKFGDVVKLLVKERPDLLNNYIEALPAGKSAELVRELVNTIPPRPELVASVTRALDGPQWTKLMNEVSRDQTVYGEFRNSIGRALAPTENAAVWRQIGTEVIAARTFAAGFEARRLGDSNGVAASRVLLNNIGFIEGVKAGLSPSPVGAVLGNYADALGAVAGFEQSLIHRVRSGDWWTVGGASRALDDLGGAVQGLQHLQRLAEVQELYDGL